MPAPADRLDRAAADAGAATHAAGATGPASDPAAPAGWVDLLHAVPAIVAVSSTVANPNDRPDFLVDGKLETAWNSRTRDLVGSWIAFRLPKEVLVAAVRLTVGYVRTNHEGDLFAMNHRIRRVRLVRLGEAPEPPKSAPATAKPAPLLLGEFTLDPDSRALQTITLAQPWRGGDFRLEVTEVVPGTKQNWREICVSEFQVLGTLPPTAKPKPRTPIVRVGDLGWPLPPYQAEPSKPAPIVLTPVPLKGPSASIQAYCTEYTKEDRERIEAYNEDRARARERGEYDPGCYPGFGDQECRLPQNDFAGGPFELATPAPPFDQAFLYVTKENMESATLCHLAIATGGKIYVEPEGVYCSGRRDNDPEGELKSLDFKLVDRPGKAGASRVLVFRYRHVLRLEEGYPDEVREYAVFCGIGKSATPSCTGSIPLAAGSWPWAAPDGKGKARASGTASDAGPSAAASPSSDAGLPPIRYDWQASYRFLASGELELYALRGRTLMPPDLVAHLEKHPLVFP